MSFGKFRGLFLATTLLGSTFVAPMGSADTITDAVKQALATNPRMSVFLSNRESIDHELRRERGLYLPQVDVGAGIGWQQYDSRASRLVGKDDDFLTREEYSVIVTQRIFDGFETVSKIRKQKARIESAARRVFENAEVLALDAINAFLEVRRQRELLVLAEDNLAAHDAMLVKLEERAGVVDTAADVVQTKARRSLSQNSVLRIQNELRDAVAAYRRVVGETPTELELPVVDKSKLPQGWEDASALVKANNPTEKIFVADIKVAKSDVDIAEVDYYPKVDLQAEYSHLEGADGDEDETESAMLMLRLRWNLYRGGSDMANKRAALARVTQARNRRYDAANDALEEMRISWNAYEITALRVTELTQTVDFNQQTLDSYLILFETQNKSLLDVLDAQIELFVSEGLLTTAKSNLISASYRMLAAGGKLLETLGVQAPKQANPESPSFAEQVFPN